jgi:hypothetical protein
MLNKNAKRLHGTAYLVVNNEQSLWGFHTSNQYKKEFFMSKKSERETRNQHLDDGAILIEFEYPFKEEDENAINNWRSVEKYGFKITTDGCLISHSCRWFSKKPTMVNYVASLKFFEDKENDDKHSDEVNKHGWPLTQQYSHLCHYQNCCSPYHLVIEAQWKNLKRNFCGYDGECDCGLKQKCKRTYHNTNYDHDFEFFSYNTEGLKGKIKEVIPGYSFKILPKNHYVKDDEKKRE